MSGKRAKPKGEVDLSSAAATELDASAELPAPPSRTTTTDLLERPIVQTEPVLPGHARAGARNAARAERQRRDQRRRLIAVGCAAALLVGVVGWFLANRGGSDQSPAGTPAGRTQSTVLLQIGDRTVTGLALLATDPATGDGAVVLLPTQLMVDVAGFGPMTLGAAAALDPAAAGANALADSLGVTVDGTWVLGQRGFAALVDAAGGVTVDVDTDITGPGTTKGTEVILIPAGTQTLDGSSAVVYAAFLGEGEPEQSRLARLDAVLSAVLAGLPTDADAATLQIGALGARSTSTLPELLPTFLTNLRSAEANTSVVHRTLPVKTIDAGGPVAALGIDTVAASALVKDLLASSAAAQRPGGDVRVLVQNGVGTPGLGSGARDRLVAEGFTYVAGGNASSFGNATSVVLITDSTAAKRAEGLAIANALGLSEKSLRVTSQGQSIADVVVVLGKDYSPPK